MLLAGAAPATAQRPAVSRNLARALAADSLAPVWLFARADADPAAIAAWVRSAGGTVRRQSRWLRAVSTVLPPAALASARELSMVARLQPVARFRRARHVELSPAAPFGGFAIGAPTQDSVYGPSAMPFRRMNLFPLVDAGLTGAGVRIAILDSGFETGLDVFAGTTIAGQYDFVFNDSIVRNEPNDTAVASSHGTAVWSLLAARAPGTLVGIAPDASYLLAKTEDVRSETPLEEDNYVAGLEWADSAGAHLITSSLGYLIFDDSSGYRFADLNGDIAVTTRAADSAAARGLVLLTAMGNEGPNARTLITPADGDSVLGIGAEDSLGTIAQFSSRGPTADGRLKPDFTAPGVAVVVALPVGTPQAAFGRLSGTSFATPILAGGAALFLQAHPGYQPIAIRDALRAVADNRVFPDNIRGWGRPDVHSAVTFPRGLRMVESGDSLRSVTPRFTWTVPDAPSFATPFTFGLRVERDSGDPLVLLDTTLTDSTAALTTPLHGGVQLSWRLTAVSADSAAITRASTDLLVIPAWVTLETLNDPAGETVRDLRPEFEWSSPDVEAPPGPFTYDIEIVRADNGQVEVLDTALATTSFVPPFDLERNTPYRWRVTAHLGAQSEVAQSPGTFVVVDETPPLITTLFQNFPNPFPKRATGQATTCLWFDLAVPGTVTLQILDLRGLVVKTLIPTQTLGPILRPGRYGRPEPGVSGCDPLFTWDGTAADGRTVNPGVYIAKLAAPEGTFFRRIVFLGAP